MRLQALQARLVIVGAGRLDSSVSLGIGLLMAIVCAFDLRELLWSRAAGQWPFDLSVGIAITAFTLLRGRRRAGVAVGGLVVFAALAFAVGRWSLAPAPLMAGTLIALAVLVDGAARTLPPKGALRVAAFGAAFMVAAGLAHTSYSLSARANLALGGTVIWGCALAIGVWLRHVDERRAAKTLAIRREERRELARELHDIVAHHVTGILVQAQAARFAGSQRPEASAEALANIETASTETLFAMRRLVGLLREPDDDRGRAAPEPIDQLLKRFSAHCAPVELRAPAHLDTVGWPPEIVSTAYRVIQEALTNVVRHAPGATAITVGITPAPGRLTIEVIDNGPPATAHPPRADGGYGLIGMRERVQALGGTLRYGPGPGPDTGWEICVRLPLPETARA